ncbi:MAG: endonuclease MutS2 [Bacteroidia bacterium]
MIYPKNIEQKLEFDQVKNLVAQKCLSDPGREYISKIRFVNRFDVLEKMLKQADEFKKILSEDDPFPSDNYFNIQPFFSTIAIEGSFLQEENFYQLLLMLQTFRSIYKYFDERKNKYPQLEILFLDIQFHSELIKSIAAVINEEGKMRPDASPELARISSKINEKEKEVRSKINKIFLKANENSWLADSGISIRDGRLVLPVLAEHKRSVSGFVHDESATGQTFFIEPAEVFELNNLVRELQLDYQRERKRILISLTSSLRPFLPELQKYQHQLALIDFIRAKALFALDIDANLPILKNAPGIKLEEANHPLLFLNHKKAGLKIVTLNIELNSEKRIVVISGPNAGGKSVCLKTVGLLQLMLQSGFLIPVRPHSECGIFKELMADIGDEQSIENDLSTYSSHLVNMKYFTDFGGTQSLFLIDEFGTGTDPQFGGPLAESILKKLNEKRSFGVVTTHYSNLKNFASETPGLENACMLFHHEKMQPTYVLEQGKPGSSHAFEIAARTGLSKEIIDYAKIKVGGQQQKLDDILIELENEKRKVYELKTGYEGKLSKQKNSIDEYTKLKSELDLNKKKILKDAKLEALAIITEANSRIENTIRELREKNADTETMRSVRKNIKEVTEELKTETSPLLIENVKPETHLLTNSPPDSYRDHNLTIGSRVRLNGQMNEGEIVELKKNKAFVSFGEMNSWVELKKLEIVAGTKKETTLKTTTKGIDMNEKLRNFTTDLNIIGIRGEDAVRQVQQFLDDSFLLGFKQVRIVHGRGYGILRKLVREHLKSQHFVLNFTDEHIDHGGDAVTLVTLKV